MQSMCSLVLWLFLQNQIGRNGVQESWVSDSWQFPASSQLPGRLKMLKTCDMQAFGARAVIRLWMACIRISESAGFSLHSTPVEEACDCGSFSWKVSISDK